MNLKLSYIFVKLFIIIIIFCILIQHAKFETHNSDDNMLIQFNLTKNDLQQNNSNLTKIF